MKLIAVIAVVLMGESSAFAVESAATPICAGEQCRQMQEAFKLPVNSVLPVVRPMSAPIPSNSKTVAQAKQSRKARVVSDRISKSHAHPEPQVSVTTMEGNLPAYFASLNDSSLAGAGPRSSGPDAGFFMTFPIKKGILNNARASSVFSAVIEQAILASRSTPNPITATLTNGPLAGATLLGEATFGKELKCILLNFTLLKNKTGDATYQLKAVGIAPSGEACLEGEYESQNGRFFLAEMLASGTAVIVDSEVNRSQNALGNYVEEPSLANAAKKGLAASLTRTAEHAADGLRSAPEFTRLAGFQNIRVIFQSDPVEN